MSSEDKDILVKGYSICNEKGKEAVGLNESVAAESKTGIGCAEKDNGEKEKCTAVGTMDVPLTPRKDERSPLATVTPGVQNDLVDSPINDMSKLTKRIPKRLGHLKIVPKSSEEKKHCLSNEVENAECCDGFSEGKFSPVDEVLLAKEAKVRRLALYRGKKVGRVIGDNDDVTYEAGGKLSLNSNVKEKGSSFLHCIAGYNPGGGFQGVHVTRESDMMDVHIQEKMDSISGFMTELKSMHDKSGFTPSLFAILYNMQASFVKYGISSPVTHESLEKDFKKMMNAFDNYDMESFTRFHQSVTYQMFNKVYKSQNNEHTLGGSVFAWNRGGTVLRAWLDLDLLEKQGTFRKGKITVEKYKLYHTSSHVGSR